MSPTRLTMPEIISTMNQERMEKVRFTDIMMVIGEGMKKNRRKAQ